jgi:histidinol-phosphate aminotransferase
MIHPRRVVAETEGYSPPAASRRDALRLDLNENAWGCSPKVVEAIRRVDWQEVSIYPEYDSLRGQLAKHLGVGRENILLTNGADDAIRCIVEAYLEKGSEVVLPVPTFTVYEQHCQLGEADVREVPFNDDLSYPVQGVLDAVSPSTRMVVLVNPNNPTGTSLSGEQLRAILDAAGNSVVILDEAYCHYAGVTHVGLVEEYPNLMVVRTFSKAYGLAGLRMGFVVSAVPNIDSLARVNPPFAFNSLAVVAARAALEDEGWVERVVDEVKAEKRFLREELGALGIDSPETQTNFLLARTGLWTESICEALRDAGILVKSLRGYPLLDRYLRITVGQHQENLRLLGALKEIVQARALLFDMDGVLVDVSDSYTLAVKNTAEQFLGQEVSLSEIEAYRNRGGFNNDWNLTAALIASRGQEVSREQVIEAFQRHYLGERFDGLIQNEEWLLRRDLLEQLSGDYALGIVTGRPRAEADYSLEHFQVRDLFDVVVGLEDCPQGKEKPDPYGIELAMRSLGVRCAAYVGDTIDDLQAAMGASAIPVGVVRNCTEAREQCQLLSRHGAQLVLEDVNEIAEVVE